MGVVNSVKSPYTPDTDVSITLSISALTFTNVALVFFNVNALTTRPVDMSASRMALSSAALKLVFNFVSWQLRTETYGVASPNVSSNKRHAVGPIHVVSVTFDRTFFNWGIRELMSLLNISMDS